MTRRSLVCLVVVLALLVAVGCAGRETGRITCTVDFGHQSFAVGTPLTIRIVDVTRGQDSVVTETRQTLVPGWAAPGTFPPRDFLVAYDPGAIDPAHSYAISAQIGGQTSAPMAVLTNGAPTKAVRVTLTPR